MEINNDSNTPFISVVLSLFSGILSWLSLHDAQYFISFLASVVALISGVLAMRYYYYAGNDKKSKQLKSDKNGE
jgi:membrane associated rhomboid family serine protease